MSRHLVLAGGIAAALAMQTGAPRAQLITEKRISSTMAHAIAQTAQETCKAQGYSVWRRNKSHQHHRHR